MVRALLGAEPEPVAGEGWLQKEVFVRIATIVCVAVAVAAAAAAVAAVAAAVAVAVAVAVHRQPNFRPAQ